MKEEDKVTNIDDPKCAGKINLHQFLDTNLLNLNGGMLAAVEIITTGPRPRVDSIIQVCILPLNASWKPHQGILPFYASVVPLRKDLIDWDNLSRGVNRERIFKCIEEGIHAWELADRLTHWVERIKFKKSKKIFPLAHNWPLKSEFIKDWLGEETFDNIFDYRVRDLLSAALYANDKADFQIEQIPYPKQNLTYLFAHSGVEYTTWCDAMDNAKAMIDLYFQMLSSYY